MLGGIAPIFLFNFFKLRPDTLQTLKTKVPIIADIIDAVGLPPIPLYLDENLTGVFVDSESKNIDLETDVEAKKDASKPTSTQRILNSTVTIEMVASKDSIGATILAAMMDVILPKITSKEYSISYLHGATTVFGGQLHAFAVNQNANDTKLNISVTLSKSNQDTQIKDPTPVVSKVVGTVPA